MRDLRQAIDDVVPIDGDRTAHECCVFGHRFLSRIFGYCPKFSDAFFNTRLPVQITGGPFCTAAHLRCLEMAVTFSDRLRKRFEMSLEARLCCAWILRIRLPVSEARLNALASLLTGFSARFFLLLHRFALLRFQIFVSLQRLKCATLKRGNALPALVFHHCAETHTKGGRSRLPRCVKQIHYLLELVFSI